MLTNMEIHPRGTISFLIENQLAWLLPSTSSCFLFFLYPYHHVNRISIGHFFKLSITLDFFLNFLSMWQSCLCPLRAPCLGKLRFFWPSNAALCHFSSMLVRAWHVIYCHASLTGAHGKSIPIRRDARNCVTQLICGCSLSFFSIYF